jgi:hypothetical protein
MLLLEDEERANKMSRKRFLKELLIKMMLLKDTIIYTRIIHRQHVLFRQK